MLKVAIGSFEKSMHEVELMNPSTTQTKFTGLKQYDTQELAKRNSNDVTLEKKS